MEMSECLLAAKRVYVMYDVQGFVSEWGWVLVIAGMWLCVTKFCGVVERLLFQR